MSWILTFLVVAATWSPEWALTVKSDRSYQLAPISVINGVPGVQYVPMATTLYSEIPTVLVPKQVGMDVVALQSAQSANLHKFYEPSTSLEEYRPVQVQEPVLQPMTIPGYALRKVKSYPKRPYHGFGRKKLGHSPYHNQKVSAISIEPSIDITDQLRLLQNGYPSTTPQPHPTYGPAKVVEHKGVHHVGPYLRPKGHHPHYHPKDYRVYSHMHKGHVHNHYIPKSQYHSSSKPIYSTVLQPTQTTYLESSSNAHPLIESGYKFGHKTYSEPFNYHENLQPYGYVRIHNPSKSEAHQPHMGLTQAIIRETGTINNYDASVPLKAPSKKPNKFEVKEILRNAEVHFIDGTLSDPEPEYVHVPQVYSSKPAYVDNGFSHNHIDYHDQGEGSGHDPTTSDSVKVPVAVIKGTRRYPIDVTRSEPTKKSFTPSSTHSDWIPMSGKQESSSEKYFGDLLSQEKSQPTRIITSNRNIGDIISGKIPSEYSPFRRPADSDIVVGKIPFPAEGLSDVDRRKGSVIDDNPTSSDTSNLVVSSMIKFS